MCIVANISKPSHSDYVNTPVSAFNFVIMFVLAGERPFKCEVCSKGFNQSNALKIHLRKHRGERPYQCIYCTMAFTQKGNLKTHIRRAHPNEPDDGALHSMSQSDSDRQFLLANQTANIIKLSDGSTVVKISDASSMRNAVSDDLDLTSAAHLSFM